MQAERAGQEEAFRGSEIEARELAAKLRVRPVKDPYRVLAVAEHPSFTLIAMEGGHHGNRMSAKMRRVRAIYPRPRRGAQGAILSL